MWFPPHEGLHHGGAPDGIRNPAQCDAAVIHRGFATNENIVKKYLSYKSFGQRGWDLDRLIDESTLNVERIPDKIIPEWYNTDDNIDPRNKQKLVEIYKDQIP
jgi:hypothetical protein